MKFSSFRKPFSFLYFIVYFYFEEILLELKRKKNTFPVALTIISKRKLPAHEPFHPSHFHLATPNQLDVTLLGDCRQNILTSFAYPSFEYFIKTQERNRKKREKKKKPKRNTCHIYFY